MNRYSPAETANRSGFSLDTLRYYERIGLLHDIDRTPGGQRIFTDDDLGWLGILRCLRDTGMPIAQMLRYAELARGGEETLAERKHLLQQHAQDVEQRLTALHQQQQHLHEKIAWYQTICPDPPPSPTPTPSPGDHEVSLVKHRATERLTS